MNNHEEEKYTPGWYNPLKKHGELSVTCLHRHGDGTRGEAE
jgi:hypothetical protein